ncbi:MAG: nicotinamide-nucleotide amidohydrolase family protein [Oscillospiraceae bacterium]|nr:nicotinamide-nucleotide amidohydrolase family protein [Oscillospiraceae bacterium]
MKVHFYGVQKDEMLCKCSELFKNMQSITADVTEHGGECIVHLTDDNNNENAVQRLNDAAKQLQSCFADNFYGINCGSLQAQTVRRLKEKGLQVATAESCTGGYVSKRITEIEGSSQVFKYGAVTYCDEAKMKLINVKESTLKAYTAVSEQTAREMAAGIRALSGADIGVSVTGYAGNTPVPENGIVFVGVDSDAYSAVDKLSLAKGLAHGERENIRLLAASHALSMVLKACDKL